MNPFYIKFRFVSNAGETAGLVMEANKFKQMGIGDLSRLFPMSEARFMSRLQVSPVFPSWHKAFEFKF